MIVQRTLKKTISVQGIGLHSGKSTRLTMAPGPAHSGIVFYRTDLPHSVEIPALYKHIVCTQLATTLGVGKTKISTVEHILAALQGMGIDNARIEVDGPEVPIMDGSSAPFCSAIALAGIENQPFYRPYLILRKKVEIKLAEKWAFAEPASSFEIHASIDWDHPSIGYQEFSYREGQTPFSDLASARTFGFLKDVEELQKHGLARGGSLENAVVLDHALIINPEGLRFPDEFVKHKVLDALGDFKLAGIPIRAHFRLHRAGHDLHNQLLIEIFRHSENYEIVDSLDSEEDDQRFHLALA